MRASVLRLLLLIPAMLVMAAPTTAASRPAAAARAGSRAVATSACNTPADRQFDFWLGDWRVIDAHSGRLVGFDRVRGRLRGCVIQQSLTMLTDLYRKPALGYRMAGMSISRFDGQAWLQMWADDQWGAIVMRGGPRAGDAMALTSIVPSRGRDVRLVWRKYPDGTLHILQYVAPAGSGKWTQYGDLIYLHNR